MFNVDVKMFSVIITSVLMVGAVHCAEVMKAEFSMNGVKGYVEFSEDSRELNTSISFKLSGIASTTQVFICTFPVVWDSKNRCADSVLGTSLYNLASIGSSTQSTATFQSSNFDLSGPNSVQGRALLLVNSEGRSCATIEARESSTPTAMVRMMTYISGTVFFRQAGPELTIVADLYFTDGRSVNSTDAKWMIKTGQASSTTLGSTIANGDLSATHGDLSIAATPGTARTFFLDTKLTVSDLNGNSLVVSLAGKDSIGDVQVFKGRNTTALFDMDGVKGSMDFRQHSPFDPVEVSGDIKNLRSSASGYHIHEYPVPPRLSKTDSICSGASVSGHFNPFGVDVNASPSPGVGTPDQYEVGDLSGKYGTMASKDNFVFSSVVDWNMNLYFGNSVMGRSVVIHKGDGSRWVCATISLPYSMVKTAVASFKYPVIGQIYFQQNAEDPFGETTVYAVLGHHSGTTVTNEHNFHVHVSPVGADMDSDTGRCSSVGGHFNPWLVSVAAPYSVDCSPFYPDRCELGDSSMKGGTLNIGDSRGNWKRKFYTDINLPLTGSNSVVGRSLTIHAENKGASRLACADILPLNPKYATAYQWSSVLSGHVTMMKKHPFYFTNTLLDVKNLQSLAGPYHIHSKPVPMPSSSPCSASSVGGHFNPFEVDPSTSPSPGSGTTDQYEVGDLSGKFGKVSGKNTIKDSYYDENSPMFGQHSIVGRSIVFHKDADGSRWVCANLSLNTSMMAAGEMYQASVNFNSDPIKGYIKLAQYVFTDGSMTETSIQYDLKYVDSTTKSANHNWHVHVSPVGNDSSPSSTSRCSSTGPHFNPYHAKVDSTYATDCSVTNPLRCELGDLSGKHFTIDIGSGSGFTNDVDLPLTGKYSVVGRSIVIHDKDKGPGRFVCADILPEDAEEVDVVFPTTKQYTNLSSEDKSALVSQVATALNTGSWNIAVTLSSSKVVDPDCMKVKVLLSGPKKNDLKLALQKLVDAGDSKLGKFAKTSVCNDGKPSSGSINRLSSLVFLTALMLFYSLLK